MLARFAEARSPLDMGRGARGGRARTQDPLCARPPRWWLGAPRCGAGFDPDLRVGEDVDLVWRMCDTGWRVRFEPSVTVFHDEPTTWRAWMRAALPLRDVRRCRWLGGIPAAWRRSSSAPGHRQSWPLGSAATRRWPAPSCWPRAPSTFGAVRDQGIPFDVALRWTASGAGWTLVGLGRALTTLAVPALPLVAWRSRRWMLPAALLLLAPPLVEWWRRRPAIDPLRWSLSCIVDDVSYGAGVWVGCVEVTMRRPAAARLPRSAVGGRRSADHRA